MKATTIYLSGRRFTWVLVTLAASFVLLSCNLLSRGPSSTKTNAQATEQPGKVTATASASGQSSQSGGSQPELALQAGLPRSFRYAGLVFNLQKAVISTQPPEGANESDQQGAYALTAWKVSNPSTGTIRVQQGVFTLKVASGSTYTRPYDEYFNSQDTKDVNIVFSVPASTKWDSAVISFTEPDKVPAVLPLTGEVPADPYPQKLTAAGEAQLKTPVLVYQLQEASIDMDGMGQRAQTGTRYLLVKVNATCKDRYDCFVGDVSFRVLADGTPYSSQTIDPVSAAIKVDSSQVFRLAYQIPDQAKKIELQVGEAGKDTANIPINLPAGQ